VEAIRALMVAKRSARSERTQTNGQARALIITGPDDLRARFARHAPADLVADLAALRPRPGSMVRYHTLLSLRELGRRAQFLDDQLARLDELIVPLVTARAPGLLALYGAGPPAPPRSCWSPPATTPGGCGRRLPGRTCAPPPRSPHPRARSPATASTPAATGRPTTPSTGS
jgi:hypothetical protein